jgi:ABC-type transport system involved in cytochrome c biogenesis permease component
MISIPILAREAKRAAKRQVIYRFRLGAVVLAVFTAGYLLRQITRWTSSAAIGHDIFQVLVWIGFGFCLLSGVLFSSGLLCQERRDGSLALLFLTHLTGLDVILGKLTAILLITCQVVLALFPVLALCTALGGVSIGEFWRAAAVLLATLSLSLAIGLFVSALNRELSRSVLISFALITIPTAAVGFFDAMLRQSFPGTPVGALLPGLVPLITSISDEAYAATPGAFQSCLAYQFLFAGCLLLMGGRMLKRLSIQTGPPLSWIGRMIHRRSAIPAGERRELLRRNPIYWVSQRHRWRWLTTWTLFCLLIVVWFFALEYFQFVPALKVFTIFVMAPFLHLLLKLAMAAEAVSRLSGSCGGELELLLCTPLTSGQIIRGQQRGLMRQFMWPIITMLAVDVGFAVTYGGIPSQPDSTLNVGRLLIYTLGISMVIDAPALATVGMWHGLSCEKIVEALRRTILQVVILPLFIFFPGLLLFFGPLASSFQSPLDGLDSSSDFWVIGLILWSWLVSFVTNAIVQRGARFHLKTFLRFIAADPSGARAVLNRRVRGSRATPFSRGHQYAPQLERA